MKKTITVIDTFGFLFRSYYALPPLKSKNGFPTGLLTGFMNFIANIGKDFQTDYLVFALDSKGDTFRNELFDQYKANRQEVPEELLKQLPIAIEWIEKMGFKTASKVGFEADDIIASIAIDARQKDLEVRIVSHDKDLYQLIDDDSIYLFDPIKKSIINEKSCIEKYGVTPKQFIDYQALIGDSADNIPGVKGIGAKTAEALIKEFGTLDNIYNNLENIEKIRWKNLLKDGKEMAFISKQLVTLRVDCHAIEEIEHFELPKENPVLKIAETLLEFDLNRIIDRVNKDGLNYKTQLPKKIKKFEFETILLNEKSKLFDVINSIKEDSLVSFDTETTNLDVNNAKIVGFSFAFDDKKAYYVPISHFYLGVLEQISLEDAKKALILLNNFKLVAQNFKYDYQIIKKNFNLEMKIYADTMLMSWLLNPNSKLGLDFVAQKYFNHDMISFSDIVKKGEDFSSVEIEKAALYASEDAIITYKLYFKLLELFKETKLEYLLKLGETLEFNFTKVLANMEENGIKIDIEVLEELKTKNAFYLQNLTKNIYKQAQCEFNINSPKQLGEILFDKLSLKASKKTKSGYSTNEMVLQSLYNEHEIIPLLLNYREAYKLQSTYIEPLLQLSLQTNDNRIYTSFLQTGTTTGRLSSKNPNLQNIPVKSEAGSQIRSAFIPKEGHSLVGIDYSQIELRLLAHFSQDRSLVEAFNNNFDIHRQTAVKIFGEAQADNKRAIAKSINFGLLYGMGSRKLADTLKIDPKEAKNYIQAYFEAFKSVKDYLKSIEDFILQNHYVETLLKRRRVFDFNSANGMQKAAFLREGVNTKFQGSAADLIKLSMLKIWEKYKNNNDIKMLLQIHDELIFEIKDEKIDEITNDLVNIMENIVKLEIPLKVSKKIGKSWQELK